MAHRTLKEVRTARPSRDGDGVAIQRISGMRHAGMDPILLLDELRAENREDYIGGFPPHPHRGMQTLTYMLHGGIAHEDSEGNRGEIRGGGAQWMSAGRGIIHSEMPTRDSDGLHGFQLWVNLAASEKDSAPRYRDLSAAELTQWRGERGSARVISGTWQFPGEALEGPLAELAPRAAVLDLELLPDAELALSVPAQDNLLGYVYQGAVSVAQRDAHVQQMFITGEGDTLALRAGQDGARLLLMRGRPLGEPVANYGPFVMNTPEQIEQTLREYQTGQFPQGAME